MALCSCTSPHCEKCFVNFPWLYEITLFVKAGEQGFLILIHFAYCLAARPLGFCKLWKWGKPWLLTQWGSTIYALSHATNITSVTALYFTCYSFPTIYEHTALPQRGTAGHNQQPGAQPSALCTALQHWARWASTMQSWAFCAQEQSQGGRKPSSALFFKYRGITVCSPQAADKHPPLHQYKKIQH